MRHCNNLHCFKKRQLKFISILSLLMWVISSVNFIIHINKSLELSNLREYFLCSMDFILSFDIISILQDTNFTYMINPLFCACCLYIITINSRMVRVIRYNSKDDLWNNNFFLIIFFSFIISGLLVFGTYILGGIVLGNFNNTWISNNGYFYKLYCDSNVWIPLSTILTTKKMLFIMFFSTFICLSMFGSIINVLNIFIKQRYTFIIIVSLVFIDYINICEFSPLKSNIISLDNIININTLIIKNISYILLTWASYILGKFFMEKKDQFFKDNKIY